jgi:hypothetical protein
MKIRISRYRVSLSEWVLPALLSLLCVSLFFDIDQSNYFPFFTNNSHILNVKFLFDFNFLLNLNGT